MQKSIYLVIAILCLAITFENCKVSQQLAVSESTYSVDNVLALYGKYLYEREDCASCHVLSVAEQTGNLVSLDGLGGKYKNDWFYVYLREPTDLVFSNADQSAFPHLHQNALDKTILEDLVKKERLATRQISVDTLWNAAVQQSDQISEAITIAWLEEPIEPRTEVFAMMAYLQEIPTTALKQERDSMEWQRLLDEQRVWDDMPLDSNSLVYVTAQIPENAIAGKTIFKQYCQVCHNEDGRGGIGPNLTDEYWLHGGQTLDIASTIIYGVPEKGMISWQSMLQPRQVGEVVAYIHSLQGTNPANAKAPQGVKED